MQANENGWEGGGMGQNLNGSKNRLHLYIIFCFFFFLLMFESLRHFLTAFTQTEFFCGNNEFIIVYTLTLIEHLNCLSSAADVMTFLSQITFIYMQPKC